MKAYCVSRIVARLLFIVVSMGLLSQVNTVYSANKINPGQYKKIVFGCYTTDINDFEEFVVKAKNLGATHINITAEDLPKSYWQYDTPGDPYPAWVITNTGLLKICRPKALEQYLPSDYSKKVLSILEQRCKVLRKYGMKAAFSTFEPQMLPEQVFADHPLWRGARVKQLGLKPVKHSVLYTGSSWDRQMIFETARREIDNTALLMETLKSTDEPLLYLAPVKEEEDIRVLGMDMADQLQKKLNIMNVHWEDYNRIFDTPNK